jgi:hypothetical protein
VSLSVAAPDVAEVTEGLLVLPLLVLVWAVGFVIAGGGVRRDTLSLIESSVNILY